MIYQPGILVGRIIKIHGYEGTVIVRLEKIFIENVSEMESVFLEIEGKPVPFFIFGSEYTGGDIIKIKFEGYHSYEKVSELKGCKVFLTGSGGNKNGDNNYTDIRGFRVIVHDNQLAGTIIEVIENPGQWLLKVKTEKEKELLIPFHEDLIIKVDKKLKIIQMDLPEGLTEIN